MIKRTTYSEGLRFWYVHDRKLGIVELQGDGSLKTLTTSGETLRIYGYDYSDEVLTDGSDYDDPIDVHELAERALVDKVVSDLYKRGDMLDMGKASYFHRSYVGEITTALRTLNKKSNEDVVRGV